RTAEIDSAAHHPYAWAITEDIFRISGIDTTHYCNAASFELCKGIPHIPEVPRLGRIKAWIVLCHGVAPCAAAALHIQNAPGSSIESAVSDVSKHSYLCAAV